MLLRMFRSTYQRSSAPAHALRYLQTATMRETAYVRYKRGADNLTISLVLAGRQRNLNRPVDEPLEKPFTRIRSNLAPAKQDKRSKKKKLNPADGSSNGAAAAGQQQQEQELFVGLFKDAEGTELIDPSTPNEQAWTAASLLKVGDQVFEVLLNPPTVETLNLQDFPMAGYPLLPVVGLAFADLGLCRWRWFKRPQQAPTGAEWEETGCSSMCYTPTQQDIGTMLRVECIPANAAVDGSSHHQQQHNAAFPAAIAAATGLRRPHRKSLIGVSVNYGEPLTAETGPVRTGPQQPAARVRQLNPGVPLPEPWRFRIMSYNILADQYAGTSYAQQVLFKYCPTQLLDNNYRRQLVLQEILRYQPDICCLQEVDDKVFSEFLSPHLALAGGFNGHYTSKQGKVREGSAMFWRADKWGCAAVQDVKLRDVFKLPLSDRHSQFQAMLDSSPALVEALQKVTTIAQMVLLVPRQAVEDSGRAAAATAAGATGNGAPATDRAPSDDNKGEGTDNDSNSVTFGPPGPLLIINTHLFFHPYAPHIRSLHTAAILEEAAVALAEWQQIAQLQQSRSPAAGNLQASVAAEPGLLQQLPQLPAPTVLFCGDLNSDLNDGVPGVIEMLQTGKLAANHWDWQMGASFRWGKEEEEYAEEEQQQQQQGGQQQQQQQQHGHVQCSLQEDDGHVFDPPIASPRSSVEIVAGTDITVPFVLRSADDLTTPYTNYTSGYKALLDYVWYDPNRLFVTKQLPVPAEQLLVSYIPSPNFPSDHLAVVYDLAFKPQAGPVCSNDDVNSHRVAAGSQQGSVASSQQGLVASSSEAQHHNPARFTLLPASEDHVADAVAALQRGEVIALPTDTLYGLAAAANNTAAVQQLRRIKQRSPMAPFAVAVADVADVARYCVTDHLQEGLLRALLPGPVTVLLPLKPSAELVQGVLNPSNSSSEPSQAAAAAAATVGIRVVPNEFVVRVCRKLGSGIALTSANMSGGISSLCTQDFRDLWQYCGAVFDGGRVPVLNHPGSTIVDLTQVASSRSLQQQQQQGSSATVTEGSDASQAMLQQSGFRIVRTGVAADSVINLLTGSFGLKQLP